MEDIQKVKALLFGLGQDIVILSHRNPDGDAIGSSLGLMHYLRSLGHSVHVVLPSDYPPPFAWMPDIEDIVIFDNEPTVSTNIINRANIAFCLDFNALDRIDKVGEILRKRNIPMVMIDHHLDPEPFCDYVFSDTTASSTSEMVYRFICDLGQKHKISLNTLDCLYTGILTDTGSFKYGTSAQLFRTVADMTEQGVDGFRIQDLVFNSLNEKQLRLIGHALHNRVEYLPEFKAAIITLVKQDFSDFTIIRGDTEGIVNYLLMVKDIKLAIFVTEQPNIIKLSMRSKGDFSVQDICRKYFNGGGHKNASGGYMHSSLANVIRKIKDVLPDYKDKLHLIK